MLTFTSFCTDGTFSQARSIKERTIEFIGDSYTCGYGTESSSKHDKFLAETENCNLTYAAISGRYFDADIVHISHSGRGIVRNYNSIDPGETMVKKYDQTFDEVDSLKWEASGFTPDIVVIYLGTNDFSKNLQPSLTSWSREYKKLLTMIRQNYGEEVPILCVASKASRLMGDYRLGYAVQALRITAPSNIDEIRLTKSVSLFSYSVNDFILLFSPLP